MIMFRESPLPKATSKKCSNLSRNRVTALQAQIQESSLVLLSNQIICPKPGPFQNARAGILLWHSGLRIRRCHCRDLGDMGLIPGLETSIYHPYPHPPKNGLGLPYHFPIERQQVFHLFSESGSHQVPISEINSLLFSAHSHPYMASEF